MRKGFHSFNTPENIEADHRWSEFLERMFKSIERKPLPLRDQLPSHYKQKERKATA